LRLGAADKQGNAKSRGGQGEPHHASVLHRLGELAVTPRADAVRGLWAARREASGRDADGPILVRAGIPDRRVGGQVPSILPADFAPRGHVHRPARGWCYPVTPRRSKRKLGVGRKAKAKTAACGRLRARLAMPIGR
jgi:hypothetical protein